MVTATSSPAVISSMSQLADTYKGKKVFLTGHTGFKGSWLLYWLHLLGAEIRGYALAPDSTPSLFELLDGEQLGDSIIADLNDRATLEKELIISLGPKSSAPKRPLGCTAVTVQRYPCCL
jgi:CDP-glucose 4,6-dehydratase